MSADIEGWHPRRTSPMKPTFAAMHQTSAAENGSFQFSGI